MANVDRINNALESIERMVKQLRGHHDSFYEIASRAGVVSHYNEKQPNHPDYGLLIGASHDASSNLLSVGYCVRQIREALKE